MLRPNLARFQRTPLGSWMLALCLAILPPTVVASDGTGFDIKGLWIGQSMTDCPSGTVDRSESPVGQVCLLPDHSYADEPVDAVVALLRGGVLAGVTVSFEQADTSSRERLLAALQFKFGAPQPADDSSGQLVWTRPGQVMLLDMDTGVLITANRDGLVAMLSAYAEVVGSDM